MLAGLLDKIDNAGVRAVNGRFGFSFGPPTPEYLNRFGASFYFCARQVGLDVRWASDGAARDFIVKVGPIGMHGTIARRARVPEPNMLDTSGTLKVRLTRDGRELSTWRNWRHIGVCFEWFPPARMKRLEVGPFGVAVMAA